MLYDLDEDNERTVQILGQQYAFRTINELTVAETYAHQDSEISDDSPAEEKLEAAYRNIRTFVPDLPKDVFLKMTNGQVSKLTKLATSDPTNPEDGTPSASGK